jgi:hypothetical protein
MQTYLLDSHFSPVPVGVSGELYLGGVGLSRGYLKRPELTAERFVPNPFSTRPGGRLYRTGDLARYDGEGQLEYLGRMDQQVKLRGYRIELGEIEAVLSEHHRVQDCVVVAIGERGRQQLAAFVVARANGDANGNLGPELRRHLQQRLPHYMVPAWIEELAALPLAEIVRLPSVARHLEPLLKRHERSVEVLRQRAQARDGVVFFDVSDLDLEGYNKFIPYLLHPDCHYSVGVSASATRAKVSVGSNPWNPAGEERNLASLAERYGGGGHPRVAAISFDPSDLERARKVAAEIAAELRR